MVADWYDGLTLATEWRPASEGVAARYRLMLTNDTGESLRDFRLGILRLAARWYDRRRTKDATIQMQELGIGRVASTDPDIDRMLKLGRYNGVGVFA